MGGGVRALEHHSEATEVLFAHIPGIKVVMPSNPYDFKGMLLASIKDPDTVIFLENKKIYRAFKQMVPEGEYFVELGKAKVIVPGETITVVTYGAQIFDTLKVLEELNKEGISVELIDLRTISPIDTDTIVKSVKKTKRLLVVHEAVKSFSVSAEIITRVNEEAFLDLVAPPSRLTG
jgi:pyruvate dehydrogenase E1 component beta subunit